MTTPQLRAQIGAGAPQSGQVTVANGDSITLSVANAASFKSFRFELYTHPSAGFSCPTGWTVDPENSFIYRFDGLSPQPFAIPAATWWGKIGARVIAEGDDTKIDQSLMLRLDSPVAAIEDIAPLEENQCDPYRGWGRALSDALRVVEGLAAAGGGGGGGGGNPRVIVWNPDNGSPDATKGEAQTEAQMKALVQAVSGPALVYCIAGTSGTYTFALPTWDGQGSTLRPHPDEDNQVAIFVDDGVQLEGWDVEGLELHFNNTTPSTRAWNNPRGLYRARGCKFVNDGTAPVLFTRSGTIDLERCVFAASVSPVLVLDSAAAVVKLYTRGGLTLSANTIEGVAGSKLAMLHDGMLTKLDNQATFLGTFGNMPLGTDGGSGSFAVRPRDAGPLGYEVPDGCLYRCTTIGSDVRFIRAQNTWEVVSEDGTFVRITRRMGAAIGRGGGSYNTGTSFYTWHERYIIGARFWWVTAGGTPETVRVSIWKGGSAVHSEDFVIQPGTTFNEVAFTSAYHVPNADAAVLHKIAVWDTSGAGYTKAVGAYDPRTFNNPAGDLHEWDEGDLFGAGFTNPATAGITENYPVEPRYGMAA